MGEGLNNLYEGYQSFFLANSLERRFFAALFDWNRHKRRFLKVSKEFLSNKGFQRFSKNADFGTNNNVFYQGFPYVYSTP